MTCVDFCIDPNYDIYFGKDPSININFTNLGINPSMIIYGDFDIDPSIEINLINTLSMYILT